MLILTADEIKKVFTMKDAIEADKDALRMYASGKTNIPLRVNIDIPKYNGQSLFMPGYAEEIDATGIKIVSVFPQNIEKGKPSVPAQMVVLDGTTGEVTAIMNGTYLTQLRTGAVAGAATDILSNKDSKKFALFGTGGQAESQLEAVLTVRDIKTVKVFDINKERAEDFANRMSIKFADFGAEITAAVSSEDAVRDADIVTTVTTSKRAVFESSNIKAGAHINGIGCYTPDMQEIDSSIFKRTNKIYVDTRNGVLSEAGDFIKPINEGIISEKDVTGELGEVITGSVKGREASSEITIFKSVGTAVLDIVVAHKILQKAMEKGIGTKVEL